MIGVASSVPLVNKNGSRKLLVMYIIFIIKMSRIL